MKILKAIFVTFCLATMIAAQTPTTIIPIVDSRAGGLLGGVRDGRWIKPEAFAATMKGGEEYGLVPWSSDAAAQTLRGTKPTADMPCEDFFQVEFDPKLETGLALGSEAKWKPVPRQPVALSLTDPVYTGIVRSIVRARGIARPKIDIRQAYKVDLDGDGIDEVILAATNRSAEMPVPGAAAGEYSFLLVRKMIGGKVKNIVIAGEFHPRAVKFGAISEYQLSAIADLNGDGKMEVIMYSAYYEGAGSVVYEIEGATANEVLATGCGA